MIYVVLGMGFSGTTLASELIHHAGVAMIDAEEDRYDDGGKYEHPRFQEINKRLLNLADDRVMQLRPCMCPDSPDAQLAEEMASLIKLQMEQYSAWGFKDPRTVVTYPLWCRVLPNHSLISIYRDPAGNWPRHRWQGYRKRYTNGWRAFVHLRQWCEYNEAILKYGKKLGEDFLLLNYERLMAGDDENMRLQFFLDRNIKDRRRASMYRARSMGDALFRLVRGAMNTMGPWSPMETMRRLEQERTLQITRLAGQRRS